jgi:hypothetical protein
MHLIVLCVWEWFGIEAAADETEGLAFLEGEALDHGCNNVSVGGLEERGAAYSHRRSVLLSDRLGRIQLHDLHLRIQWEGPVPRTM